MTFLSKTPSEWTYAVNKFYAEEAFVRQFITDRLPNYDALCDLDSANDLSSTELRESLRVIDNLLGILRASIVRVHLTPKDNGNFTARCSLVSTSRELTTMEQRIKGPACGEHTINLQVIRSSIAYILDQRGHKSPPPAGEG